MQLLAATLVLIAVQSQTPVVLQNGYVRLELEPRTFSVRFAGFPGGKNFLEPVHLTESEIAGPNWVDPGGLTTDLLPARENSALLRRGPAEVVVQEERYVLLLGPEHPDSNWRVKKEYFLEKDTPEGRYKVTVTSARKTERRVGIRIAAQVVRAGQWEISGDFGVPGLMLGQYPDLASVTGADTPGYIVPLAGGRDRRRAVLAVPGAPEVTQQTPFGTWSRRLELASDTAGEGGPASPRLVLLLDDATHVYQAGLEAMQSGVNVGAPLVIVEHWVFSPTDTRIAAE